MQPSFGRLAFVCLLVLTATAVSGLAASESPEPDRPLEIWVGPTVDVNDLDTAEDVESVINSGELARGDIIEPNETLVVEIQRPDNLALYTEQTDREEATKQFVELLEEPLTDFTINLMNAGPSQPQHNLKIADASDLRVIHDADRDRIFVVATVAEIPVDCHSEDTCPSSASLGDQYSVRFKISGKTTANRFTVGERTASVVDVVKSDDIVQVQSTSKQFIAVDTNLDRRSDVTVHVRGETPSETFEWTAPVSEMSRRSESGMFVSAPAAEFNFSDVPQGTQFDIDVRFANESLLDSPATGVVVTSTSVDIVGGGHTNDEAWVLVDAELDRDGFVVLRADDTIVGASSRLAEGTHQSVRIDVEDPVTDVTAVTYEATGDSNEFQADAAEPITRTGAVISDEMEFTDVETTTVSEQPGFGSGVAVVALLAAVLLRERF